MKEKVSAVVCAYNEGERIEEVLRVLVKTKILSEIIVVNDGSKDNTEEIVRKFKKIRYFKNLVNKGKAFSMDRAVKESKNEIIFFCDADLIGLTPKIVEDIVQPVLDKKVDMFIGKRSNIAQRWTKAVALLSGERALRKKLWIKLPKFYKYRYRIETGLNFYSKYHGRGYDSKTFPYSQPFKEKKYGLFKGFFLRVWMYWDVIVAFLRASIIDRFSN